MTNQTNKMISSKEIEHVKLLMVGAGGIGCELLKNLVLTGFKNIEIIDLDTIELSNLNRQFLFQKQHVGQSKALVAKQSALKFNPNVNIVAYHDSIFNAKFNIDYFKQFTLVLNALDNKTARSHVNRLCLAANVPLIESGSSGYLGNVSVICKGLTECYDCLPKPAQKTFPGCTIRNTPSEPIHCIVWAKHLFNQLFGREDPDEAVSPDAQDPENMTNGLDEVAREQVEQHDDVVRVSTRQWAKQTCYDTRKLFNKLFNDDIKYLLCMAKLWQNRKAPEPLDHDYILNLPTLMDTNHSTTLDSQRVWSLRDCLENFASSIEALKKRVELEEGGVLVWDKDDNDALSFVTAAANLRCHIFSIQMKSKFDVKSLAGNIIPAIATTNAIVAGLIVLQATKVIRKSVDECKNIYVRDQPLVKKLIVAGELAKPNAKCYVCASKPEVRVKLDLNRMTVRQFESKVLKRELAMVAPDVEIDDGSGRIMISSEEGETDDNNEKVLSFFGLTNGSSLKCDDFAQNYELKIILIQCNDLKEDREYEVVTDSELGDHLASSTKQEIQVQEMSARTCESRKRSLSFDELNNIEQQHKKLKTINNDNPMVNDEKILISMDDDDDDCVCETRPILHENKTKEDKEDDIIECLSDDTTQESSIKELKSDDDILEIEEATNKQKLVTISSTAKKHKSQSKSNNDNDDIITLS